MPIFPSMHWITKSIIDAMKYHAEMHDYICIGKVNTSYICCNNAQQWSGVVYKLNPTFFDFVDDLLHYVTHSNKHFLRGGGGTWSWFWSFFFFHIEGGIIQCHKFAHINNPWFFKVIFIGLFINTPMRCALNTINVNKWNFTSLVPKVASIDIAPLSPNETMACN